MADPKVSCLMITRGDPARFRHAVDCYLRQTWPDRELVVIVDDADEDGRVRGWFNRLKRNDIVVHTPGRIGLVPALRNRSVQAAQGDLLCQWDDDDLYHSTRIRVQVERLLETGSDACFLADQMHCHEELRTICWANWPPGAPNSLVCRRSVNVRYDETHKVGTDSMVQQDLAARCKVTVIAGMPQLYTYVFHGSNLRTRAHHERLLRRKAAPSRDVLPRLDAIIEGLREYMPYPVELFCSDVWRFRLATGPAPASGHAPVAGSTA